MIKYKGLGTINVTAQINNFDKILTNLKTSKHKQAFSEYVNRVLKLLCTIQCMHQGSVHRDCYIRLF